MPFDTSMYSNFQGGTGLSALTQGLRSGLDIASQRKKQELEEQQAALQADAAKRQAAAFEIDQAAKMADMRDKAGTHLGEWGGEFLKIQDPAQLQAAWDTKRAELKQLYPEQLLPTNAQEARNMVSFYNTKYQQGLKAAALEQQLKAGQIDKNKAEIAKLYAEAGKARNDAQLKMLTGENLPIDKKEQVKLLAGKAATGTAIKSEIDSFIDKWPKWSEADRLAQARMLIKTLNSTQGQDAVGAEEVKRLASKLQFSMGNLFNDNPTQFGRDLDGFYKDVKERSNLIGGAITKNSALVDQMMGRAPQPQESMVRMLDPKGKVRLIPEGQVNAALAAGGKLADTAVAGGR